MKTFRKKFNKKLELYKKGNITKEIFVESYQGWRAYANWANTYRLQEEFKKEIIDSLWNKM